jgi:hypothetical protein
MPLRSPSYRYLNSDQDSKLVNKTPSKLISKQVYAFHNIYLPKYSEDIVKIKCELSVDDRYTFDEYINIDDMKLPITIDIKNQLGTIKNPHSKNVYILKNTKLIDYTKEEQSNSEVLIQFIATFIMFGLLSIMFIVLFPASILMGLVALFMMS